MIHKLAQSIVIRHIIKLAKPEELTTPLEQHEASIGRDSRNNPTQSNINKNTQHLDRLAEGQIQGVSYFSKGPDGGLPDVDMKKFDERAKALKAKYDANVKKDYENRVIIPRLVVPFSKVVHDRDKVRPARGGL
jgi:hypothetical protein